MILLLAAIAAMLSEAGQPDSVADMTVEQMRAVLRGAGLDVGGNRAEVEGRLLAYLGLRARFAGWDEARISAELTVPQLKDLFRSVDMWVTFPKPRLVQRLRQLVSAPLVTRDPRRRSRQTTWIVWTNPITGVVETLSTAMDQAHQDRLLGMLRERWRHPMENARRLRASLYVDDPDIRVGPESPEADEGTMEAIRELSDLEDRSMGPALRGDLAELGRIRQQMERVRRKIELICETRRAELDRAHRARRGPSPHAWHGSPMKNFASVRRSGLVPRKSDGVLFVSDGPKVAASFASDGFLIRFPFPADAKERWINNRFYPREFETRLAVPPEQIEVHTLRGFVPIGEADESDLRAFDFGEGR